MRLIKALVAGVTFVLLTACGSGSVLYEKTDVHLVLPCHQDESICLKKMTDKCVKATSGTVVGSEIREEDVPVVYVQCRPPKTEAGSKAAAGN